MGWPLQGDRVVVEGSMNTAGSKAGMTDRSKLLALADAVEKLSGPDRETDIRIKAAIYGGEALLSPFNGEWCVYRAGTTDPRAGKTLERAHGVPHSVWMLDRFTASLDAAMTLVPEGWRLWTGDFSVQGRFVWTLVGPAAPWTDPDDEREYIVPQYAPGIAATPALALTAACLRARAQAEALS